MSASSTSTSTVSSESTTTSNPRVEQVLAAAERDLDNADFKLGFFLNPLRALVVKPGLQLANLLLPTVAHHVPLVDDLTANGLQLVSNACKGVYHATHQEQDDARYQIHHATEKEFERNQNLEAEKLMAELEAKSTATQVKGFIVSAAIEFLGDPISNTGKWLGFTKQLIEFMIKAGKFLVVSTALSAVFVVLILVVDLFCSYSYSLLVDLLFRLHLVILL